jgi:biopolymer transport protein ExbD
LASRRALIAVVSLLALTACPAPRRVSGVVYAAGTTTSTGSRALKKTVQGATVTWTCPAGTGPQPQTLTTDWGGGFKSKDFYTDLPNECELVVSKPGHLEFRERVGALCGEPQSWGCRDLHVAVELKSSVEIAKTAVPLDLPPKTNDIQVVLTVVVAADGTTQVDGKPVANDDAILDVAKDAVAKNPELRAVIKADAAVPHGRVIHVLDLLKQARVTKIAFGVTPL